MFKIPPQEIKTPCKITIYANELDDKGKKVVLTTIDTICAYYSQGELVKDLKGELTRTSGSVYVNGDIYDELLELHYASIEIQGTTLNALSIKKARFQGKVVYTKFSIE